MIPTKDRPSQASPPGRPAALLPYVVTGLLLAVSLFGVAGFLWVGTDRAVGAIGGPFTLESTKGEAVTDRAFRGKYMLVYFGYTFCPDVCPTTLNEVASALDHLGPKASDVVPIFVTVDPARDTPAVLKRYTQAFSPRLVGLTGTPQEIAAVAKEYHVYYAKHVTGPGPNNYSMDHSSVLYLMGPDGRFVAPINAEQNGTEIAAAIAKDML